MSSISYTEFQPKSPSHVREFYHVYSDPEKKARKYKNIHCIKKGDNFYIMDDGKLYKDKDRTFVFVCDKIAHMGDDGFYHLEISKIK